MKTGILIYVTLFLWVLTLLLAKVIKTRSLNTANYITYISLCAFTSCFQNCVRMQYFQCSVSITLCVVVICNDLLAILISIRRWSSFFGNRSSAIKSMFKICCALLCHWNIFYWKIFFLWFFVSMDGKHQLVFPTLQNSYIMYTLDK